MKNSLRKFYKCALKFINTYPLDNVFSLIVSEGTTLFKADFGSIFIYKNNTLKRVYTTVPVSSQVEPRKNGFSTKVFETGIPIVMGRKEIIATHPEIIEENIESWVIIPLIYHNEKLGVLALESKKKLTYDKEEMNILKLFGSMASLSISKAKLYSKESLVLEQYDELLKKIVKESNSSIPTIEDFSSLLRRKLNQGDAPQFIWAELLLWETYQNIRALKASLNK